jgi:hypothetical protein
MEKYQPEGGYQSLTADHPLYPSAMKTTAVYRIDPDRIDVRVNFHQHKSVEHRLNLIKRLEERAEGIDLATAEIMRRMMKAE